MIHGFVRLGRNRVGSKEAVAHVSTKRDRVDDGRLSRRHFTDGSVGSSSLLDGEFLSSFLVDRFIRLGRDTVSSKEAVAHVSTKRDRVDDGRLSRRHFTDGSVGSNSLFHGQFLNLFRRSSLGLTRRHGSVGVEAVADQVSERCRVHFELRSGGRNASRSHTAKGFPMSSPFFGKFWFVWKRDGFHELLLLLLLFLGDRFNGTSLGRRRRKDGIWNNIFGFFAVLLFFGHAHGFPF